MYLFPHIGIRINNNINIIIQPLATKNRPKCRLTYNLVGANWAGILTLYRQDNGV